MGFIRGENGLCKGCATQAVSGDSPRELRVTGELRCNNSGPVWKCEPRKSILPPNSHEACQETPETSVICVLYDTC